MTKPELRTECAACSSWSTYTGRAEWWRGQLYGLFYCPQCQVDFVVWRPGFEHRLAADVADPPPP